MLLWKFCLLQENARCFSSLLSASINTSICPAAQKVTVQWSVRCVTLGSVSHGRDEHTATNILSEIPRQCDLAESCCSGTTTVNHRLQSIHRLSAFKLSKLLLKSCRVCLFGCISYAGSFQSYGCLTFIKSNVIFLYLNILIYISNTAAMWKMKTNFKSLHSCLWFCKTLDEPTDCLWRFTLMHWYILCIVRL